MIGLLSILAVGFFLGIRHATDPDHVVAITTIVTREQEAGRAALIGIFWGIGHTLTIYAVGSAIILFGLVIPPRIGLSMEFSVALMLILLGVLNLTGALRWWTEKFTPKSRVMEKSAAPRDANEAAGSLVNRVVGRFGLYQILRPLAVG